MSYDDTLRLDVAYDRWVEPLVKKSGASLIRVSCPEQILGSKFPIAIRFVDANGSPMTFGDGDALAVYGSDRRGNLVYYAVDMMLTPDGSAWSGTLSLNTSELVQSVGQSVSADTICEIRLLRGVAVIRCWQFIMTVRRCVLSGDPHDLNPAAQYYTAAQCDQKFGRLYGVVDVPMGASAIVVGDLGLSVAPSGVIVTMIMPSSGAPLVAVGGVSAITKDGFTVILSASVPSAGYKIAYEVLK